MSNEQTRNWPRDVLIIPIVVGLIIAVGTYFIPKLLNKGKRLTYEVDERPTSYINTRDLPGVSITVNGEAVEHLFGYRVRVWNSGDAAIQNLPVEVRFNAVHSGVFRILIVKHQTVPEHQFGKIGEQAGEDSTSKEFLFPLLNPADEDVITLITNEEAPLAVYARAESLRLIKQERHEGPSSFWRFASEYGPTIIGVFGAGLALLFKDFGERILTKFRRRMD